MSTELEQLSEGFRVILSDHGEYPLTGSCSESPTGPPPWPQAEFGSAAPTQRTSQVLGAGSGGHWQVSGGVL